MGTLIQELSKLEEYLINYDFIHGDLSDGDSSYNNVVEEYVIKRMQFIPYDFKEAYLKDRGIDVVDDKVAGLTRRDVIRDMSMYRFKGIFRSIVQPYGFEKAFKEKFNCDFDVKKHLEIPLPDRYVINHMPHFRPEGKGILFAVMELKQAQSES